MPNRSLLSPYMSYYNDITEYRYILAIDLFILLTFSLSSKFALFPTDGNLRQSIPLARVIFDFHALSSREISVHKGDIVIVLRPIDHNWVEVEDTQSGLKVSLPRG